MPGMPRREAATGNAAGALGGAAAGALAEDEAMRASAAAWRVL